MKFKKTPLFLCYFFMLCLISFPAFALRVKKVEPQTGILVLDDSRQVTLAGIHLAPEAFKSLAVLFSAQEVELDTDKALSENSQWPVVYISLKTLEMPFPFKANAQPKSSRLVLNEMLISSGLASVDDSQVFKKKETYLKLQEEAKVLGKGMWSEEPPARKKT